MRGFMIIRQFIVNHQVAVNCFDGFLTALSSRCMCLCMCWWCNNNISLIRLAFALFFAPIRKYSNCKLSLLQIIVSGL